MIMCLFFFFQAEDGIRDDLVTGVQTCALPILESIQLDGMNLREVLLKTSEFVEKTRADSQPRFIEALCYRFKGHSVVDPDKYRSAEDKEKFRKADPIVAFEHELETSGLADEEDFKQVRQELP